MSDPAPPTGPALVEKFARDLERLIVSTEPGWSDRGHGVRAVVTGMAFEPFNDVWVESADADPSAVGDLVGRVAAVGLPFTVTGPEAAMEAVAAQGLARAADVPYLGIDHPIGGGVDDLAIERIGVADADVFARTCAAGFDADPWFVHRTGPPATWADPAVSNYLGRVGDVPTCTATAVRDGDIATIYSVATHPQWRRRGHGAAITARAADDALAAGARWAVLHPTEEGWPLYRGLGFVEVARWPCWTSPGA